MNNIGEASEETIKNKRIDELEKTIKKALQILNIAKGEYEVKRFHNSSVRFEEALQILKSI